MISKLSLYTIVRENGTPPPAVEISAITLKSCVKKVFELLQELESTPRIWVKSPQSQDWLEDIKNYRQEKPQSDIYFCNDKYNSEEIQSLQIFPLQLVTNPWLKRESFLTVVSETFSCLILAQWQTGKITVANSGKRLQQPYLKMIVSFDPTTIKAFLLGLQNVVVDDLVMDIEDINIASENTLQSRLFSKQIETIESLHKNLHQLTYSSTLGENFSTTLGLQSNFLSNLVEELRSPITHMKTALSLLESKQIKGEQRQRYLQMLDRECERQNAVVSGLLAFLQLDNDVESEIVYLEEFVPGIVSTYQPLANEKQIRLGYTIPANLPPIQCPNSWLRQMIVQLLNNSLQFTPPQGRVFVQASLKDNYVAIAIADTGVGIDNKEFGNIFESFYRTRRVDNNTVVGAGLGLTIVQQLVQRCNGNIKVNSKLGKGSTFTIYLPIVPPELIETAE